MAQITIDEFLKPLKTTHFALGDYVDFHKVATNVDKISLKLHQLNYLIGKENMGNAVRQLWNENPKTFSVLNILIAVRDASKKSALESDGSIKSIDSYFKSPDEIVKFLDETGLTKLLKSKQIKNLVDYVFGVEVGLDSNARKNRSGHIMENLVATILHQHKISFKREISYSFFQEIKEVLGKDKKRFDFVIETPTTTYLIETNFYSDGGSKLNEVARAYSELASKINAVPGYEFVWITDGKGWLDARSKLEEAFNHIPSIYNLTTIFDFIDKIKAK